MPPQLGEFISPAVYDGKLNSNPKHPITNDIIACRFIDVPGKEYQGTGSSWMVICPSFTFFTFTNVFSEQT